MSESLSVGFSCDLSQDYFILMCILLCLELLLFLWSFLFLIGIRSYKCSCNLHLHGNQSCTTWQQLYISCDHEHNWCCDVSCCQCNILVISLALSFITVMFLSFVVLSHNCIASSILGCRCRGLKFDSGLRQGMHKYLWLIILISEPLDWFSWCISCVISTS